jgi:hypothetical protein
METVCHFNVLPGSPDLPIPIRLYLPGVVILVHGVNSDGEWYEATERGLCEGLNKRMARGCGQMKYDTIQGGQLTPVSYTPELTADGYIRPTRNDKTFVTPDPSYSHIIRFRWGYKASALDVKNYGANVWLNENDYWGGGPFANGCTSIADLWAEGLNDRLFLWIFAQHLNPVPGRDVYACPPRAYYVHAALRLAKLIKSIRDKQVDVPITLICHSQGNMVGIAAAFLADRLDHVQADNFILANPPLSLLPDDESFADSWTQRAAKDPIGSTGRQNDRARKQTLKNYFALIRARAGCAQPASEIDRCMANPTPQDGSTGFTADSDRCACGVNSQTTGRVTLYCNPHDQVISALTVQGIGWRGMSQAEIDATGGQGVFTQRIFAQGCEVGQAPGRTYDYWQQRWNKDAGIGKDGFWQPPSPVAAYSLKRGLEASPGAIMKFMTVVSAPVLWLVAVAGLRINAEPTPARKGGWVIPVNAPALPQPFLPQAYRYGSTSAQFDEGRDPAGNARNAQKDAAARNPADPYDSHAARSGTGSTQTDAPLGDEASEAQLRYGDRGRLRMKARRSGMADEQGRVIGEDEPDQASPEYQRWRSANIAEFLAESVDQNATDHSTIVTNAMHAEMAMAYDVAVGVSHLTEDDWRELRVEADWRYAAALQLDNHPHAYLSEYFLTGWMTDKPLQEWAKQGEAAMPPEVIDERLWKHEEDDRHLSSGSAGNGASA